MAGLPVGGQLGFSRDFVRGGPSGGWGLSHLSRDSVRGGRSGRAAK